MTFMNVATYLQLIDRCWSNGDGQKVANFLSLRHEHALCELYKIENPEPIVNRLLSNQIAEMVIYHLKCIFALSQKDYMGAHNLQTSLIQLFTKILQQQKDENWSLPILYVLSLDLRLIAQQAEKQSTESGNKNFKPGEILEKAADCLMGCFRVCAADNRSNEEDTKRIGMLNLVNQLFKVYFRINKLHLCKPLIRAIDSSPFKESFSLSQQITYRYFVGRKFIFDSNYKEADEYLTYAFENCHLKSVKNKRLILTYLVPVKMLLGYMPTKDLLERYDILQFWDLVQCVCRGDLRTFDELLVQHEQFFITSGIYLIVSKLKIIAYRNLFRKVYLLLNTHIIPVECLQEVLNSMGQEGVDLDETQCIVANLIYDGKIKGYISLQHRKIVVSKQNPFPALTSIT